MPRQITLDHISLREFRIVIPKTGGYEVQVSYTVELSDGTVVQRKGVTRYSSGHQGDPKLPANWESALDTLLTNAVTTITALENL